VLEINAHPDRLDIDESIARKAAQMGIKIAINSDAHHGKDLKFLKYGVMTARRGWLKQEDVINTWDLGRIMDWAQRKAIEMPKIREKLYLDKRLGINILGSIYARPRSAAA
jgi:hypothetical protein